MGAIKPGITSIIVAKTARGLMTGVLRRLVGMLRNVRSCRRREGASGMKNAAFVIKPARTITMKAKMARALVIGVLRRLVGMLRNVRSCRKRTGASGMKSAAFVIKPARTSIKMAKMARVIMMIGVLRRLVGMLESVRNCRRREGVSGMKNVASATKLASTNTRMSKSSCLARDHVAKKGVSTRRKNGSTCHSHWRACNIHS